MIIVSNTSPLTNLAAIGQFHLLQYLYKHIHIANEVWKELHANGVHWPGYAQVASANWIERHTIQNQLLITTQRRRGAKTQRDAKVDGL